MTESADLDQIAKLIRDAAADNGAMILEVVLSAENVPAVGLPADKFPALIRHLKPRLIYMVLTQFDAREAVESHFEVEELDGSLRKLAAKWKSRDGQSAQLILGVIADGVLHGVIDTPDWFDEFEEEAEQLELDRAERQRAAFDRLQEDERNQREDNEKKRLAPYVTKLVSDERFNAPKISAAKRLALAESMFPDLDKTSAKKAVDRAANELWLSGSGR